MVWTNYHHNFTLLEYTHCSIFTCKNFDCTVWWLMAKLTQFIELQWLETETLSKSNFIVQEWLVTKWTYIIHFYNDMQLCWLEVSSATITCNRVDVLWVVLQWLVTELTQCAVLQWLVNDSGLT